MTLRTPESTASTRAHTQFLGYGCMDDHTIERIYGLQATCVIDVPGLFFDMLSMDVCTTRHWQTTGAGNKCLYYILVYAFQQAPQCKDGLAESMAIARAHRRYHSYIKPTDLKPELKLLLTFKDLVFLPVQTMWEEG